MKSGIQLEKPVTEFLSHAAATLRADMTIDEALQSLRGSRHGQVLYFYVVDERARLVGVLPSRQLIISEGNRKIADLMNRGIIALTQRDTLFDALELFAMHRLLALPVVDDEQHILGIVEVSLYTDEVFDMAQNQQLSEVFQLIGLRVEQHKQGSPWRGFRLRMPWLFSNIIGGLVCATLGSLFEATVEHVVLIALFIPLILTVAESVAVQSMTLAIEQAASKKSYPGLFLREVVTAMLLGACTGVIVGAVAMAWRERWQVPATIGLSVAVTIVLAAALGRAVPKLIYLLKLNPRVASGPITLAIVDVMVITIYLSAATVILM
jgi:magnesium transporter